MDRWTDRHDDDNSCFSQFCECAQNITKSTEEKTSVGGHRKRRADRKNEFEKCEVCEYVEMFYIPTENETCKQRAALTSVSPMNHFRVGVNNTDYSVKDELE